MELILCLKMITPMFIYGADPRGSPELRAAPFRGAMRFWLRALLGARYGDDLNGMAAAESLVLFHRTGLDF